MGFGEALGAVGQAGSLLSSFGGDGGASDAQGAAAGQAAALQKEFAEKSIDELKLYFGKAIDNLTEFYGVSRSDVESGRGLSRQDLQRYYDQARLDLRSGADLSATETDPFKRAGFNALDSFSDIMGLSRPTEGYAKTFDTQQGTLRNYYDTQHEDLRKYNIASDKYKDDLTAYNKKVADAEAAAKGDASSLDEAIRTTDAYMLGRGQFPGYDASATAARLAETPEGKKAYLQQRLEDFQRPGMTRVAPGQWTGSYALSDKIAPAWNANIGVIESALDKYKAPAGPVDLTALGPAPTAPTEPSYMPYSAATAGAAPTAMSTASRQSALQQILDSPEMQLLYGQTSAAQTPQERFQASPGYQFAVDQGIQARNAAASSAGYLNSPRLAQELTAFGTGMANQEYGNYQTNLSNIFNRYSDRLSQIAGLGANAAGQQAGIQSQSGNVLAGLSQIQGQNLGDVSFQTGGLLSQLAANQGSNLANVNMGLGTGIANAYQSIGDAQANAALAAGQARASGYAADQNALSSGFGNLASFGDSISKMKWGS